jgi:hypothetical protein
MEEEEEEEAYTSPTGQEVKLVITVAKQLELLAANGVRRIIKLCRKTPQAMEVMAELSLLRSSQRLEAPGVEDMPSGTSQR